MSHNVGDASSKPVFPVNQSEKGRVNKSKASKVSHKNTAAAHSKASELFDLEQPQKMVELNPLKKITKGRSSPADPVQKIANSPFDQERNAHVEELSASLSQLKLYPEKVAGKPTSPSPQAELPNSAQTMDTSEDLSPFANVLMGLNENEVAEGEQFQGMVDDLVGFDPSNLQAVDVVMGQGSDDFSTPMDWQSTWRGFGQVLNVLEKIETRFQFVEMPDSEMPDAAVEMRISDDFLADEEMSQADEEMSPASETPVVDKRGEFPPPPVPSSNHEASAPVVSIPSNRLPPDAAKDALLIPSAAVNPPVRSGRPFVATVAQFRPSTRVIPQVGFSHLHGLEQAKGYMHVKKYDAALLLLSKIYVGSSKKMEILELMADCFISTNRTANAMDLLQTIAHHDKNNLQIKEKIADCLTKQSQYLKANLIYTVISKKINPAQANALKIKIAKNNELLKSLETWPVFEELMTKLGIDNGAKVTQDQLTFIRAFLRSINPRAYLMWDIEMNKVKRATIPALEGDAQVKKYPVYLEDGSILTDASGATIHLYKSADLSLLTHFTKPSLATMILASLNAEKQRNPGESDPYSFWKNQYKVCCSMLKQGSKSFFSTTGAPGIGFATYVPDPLSNIIHTWGQDCYTPTYFSAPGVTAVTGQSGKQKALDYNEFMIRFQPLASYIY
nr:tetratricopeptide repeat protein [Parachlamydiaceae bacterium]